MIKKLTDKSLVKSQKYQGTILTNKGRKIAVNIVRKHRLWKFFWSKTKLLLGQVHDIAEQLEHIKSLKIS